MTEGGSLASLRVVMLVRKPIDYDARVQREARSLARAGCRVTVVTYGAGKSADQLGVSADFAIVGVDNRGTDLYAKVWRVLEDRGLAYRRLHARSASSVSASSTESPRPPRGMGSLFRSILLTVLRQLARVIARPVRAFEVLDGNRRMIRAVTERSPHVVHAHDWNTLWIGWRAAGRASAQLVYDSHELATERNLAGPAARIRTRLLERLLVPRVDATITVCDGIADILSERYRIHRPVVLRNVPDLEADQSSDVSETLRGASGLRSDLPVVLFLGGIQTGRGIESLITSLTHSTYQVVIMGPDVGRLATTLLSQAENLGVQDRLSILPPVPISEIIGIARSADVGVATFQDIALSYRFSLPNKLFDYLAAGLPVVVSDLPEMRRLVIHYGVGMTCDPDNPISIAQAIDQVIIRKPEFAANALAASRELNWQAEKGRLLDVYRGLRA